MKNLLKKILFTASMVAMSIEGFAASSSSSSGNLDGWEPFITLKLINKTDNNSLVAGNFIVFFEEKEPRDGAKKKLVKGFTFERIDPKEAGIRSGCDVLRRNYTIKLTGTQLIQGVMDSNHRSQDNYNSSFFNNARKELNSYFEQYSAVFSFHIKDQRGSHQVTTPLKATPHERVTYHIKQSEDGYFLSPGPDDGEEIPVRCENVNTLPRDRWK